MVAPHIGNSGVDVMMGVKRSGETATCLGISEEAVCAASAGPPTLAKTHCTDVTDVPDARQFCPGVPGHLHLTGQCPGESVLDLDPAMSLCQAHPGENGTLVWLHWLSTRGIRRSAAGGSAC